LDDTKRSASSGFDEKDVQAIRDLHFNWPEWEKNTVDTVEGTTQRLVRSMTLDELLGARNYFRYESLLTNLTNDRTQNWHTRIDNIIIKRIEPGRELSAASVEQWVANTKMTTTRISENANAESAREMLTTISEGYLHAKASGMTEAETNQEILRRTLEAISSDPSIKMIFTPGLNNLLNSLQHKSPF